LSRIPLHRVLFISFLFSLPFSIRKVLIVLSEDGVFNEYTDISAYNSDILLYRLTLLYIRTNHKYCHKLEKNVPLRNICCSCSIPSSLFSGWTIHFLVRKFFLASAAFLSLLKGTFCISIYSFQIFTWNIWDKSRKNVPRGTMLSDREYSNVRWNICVVIYIMFHVEHGATDSLIL
jgi:hypothetical protein